MSTEKLSLNTNISKELRVATIDQLDEIVQVMRQAAAFKLALGDAIWSKRNFQNEDVECYIASENVRTLEVDGNVAVCGIVTSTDAAVWNKECEDNLALYVHKLCTAEQYHGRKLGTHFLHLVEREAEINQLSYVRLDCDYENEKLCNYYEDLGYVCKTREIKPSRLNGTYRAGLYEKDVRL